MATCLICGTETDEVCPDGNCRACHKSLTFEDCCSGEWERRFRRAMGAPVLDDESRKEGEQ